MPLLLPVLQTRPRQASGLTPKLDHAQANASSHRSKVHSQKLWIELQSTPVYGRPKVNPAMLLSIDSKGVCLEPANQCPTVFPAGVKG
jgi:hypothetical protein